MSKKTRKIENAIIIFAIVVLSFTVVFLSFSIVSILKNSDSDNSQSTISNADSGITVDKKLFGDVEITIPEPIVAFMGEAATELTDEQKEKGFTKAEKQADGSLKYTIKRSKYDDYLKELRESTASGFDEMLKDGSLTSVKNITYNKDFSKITITADKEKFQSGFDSSMILGCALSAQLYQSFDVDAPQKVVVEVKDSVTNEIFQTETYPEENN